MKKVLFLFLFLAQFAHSQSVGNYEFSQSTETYTPVVGTNSTATGDDGTQNGIPIGFNFNFWGINYTTFSISTNGFIRLGNPIANQSWVNTLSVTSTQAPLIAAFWDDHNRTTGSISYLVSGVAPNRILSIGWDNINLGNGGAVSTSEFGSFKMRISET